MPFGVTLIRSWGILSKVISSISGRNSLISCISYLPRSIFFSWAEGCIIYFWTAHYWCCVYFHYIFPGAVFRSLLFPVGYVRNSLLFLGMMICRRILIVDNYTDQDGLWLRYRLPASKLKSESQTRVGEFFGGCAWYGPEGGIVVPGIGRNGTARRFVQCPTGSGWFGTAQRFMSPSLGSGCMLLDNAIVGHEGVPANEPFFVLPPRDFKRAEIRPH